MTWAALGTAVATGGTGPERFGFDGAAALLGLVGTAVGIWLAVVKVIHARQEKVSGDEKEARQDATADRRDTIEAWQTLAAQRDRDLERKDREIGTATADRDRWKRIAEEYERIHEEDRAVRLVHGAWDYTTYEAAYRADLPVTPPPPLTAPRTPRGEP